jgi:hypothetical protein
VDLQQNQDALHQNASKPTRHKDAASRLNLFYCNNATSFGRQFALMQTISLVWVLLVDKTLT